jgi:hypothetical protein
VGDSITPRHRVEIRWQHAGIVFGLSNPYYSAMFRRFALLMMVLAAQPLLAGNETAEKGAIKNPYYSRPSWKLWFLDPAPVTFSAQSDKSTETKTFQPIPPERRLFPDLSALRNYPTAFLRVTPQNSDNVAGFWDNACATLDHGHTSPLADPDLGKGNQLKIGKYVEDQFIRVDLPAPTDQLLHELGVVTVSHSTRSRGHQIVRNPTEYARVEREFLFANIVYGAPALWSYYEQVPDRPTDSYDALSSAYFQSLGRSSSEVQGLFKMFYAGACLPRTTEELLKRHGLYASTLLMLFRANLPFTDVHGVEVPYENELRHRPAYYSNGDIGDYAYPEADNPAGGFKEFTPFNTEFHRYDNLLHLKRMIEMARSMKVAPPAAILRLRSMSVQNSKGNVIVPATTQNERIKGDHATMMRFWPKRGETIVTDIDLSHSYDLQNLPLEFVVQPLYPEQRNVQISRLDHSTYRITVRFDPKLPLGRIPVIVTASNGSFKSNPAFVNFYYPQTGQTVLPDQFYYNPTFDSEDQKHDQNASVFENRRPVIRTSLGSELVTATVGQAVRFDVTAEDPERFPIHFYRWSSDVGTFDGRTFTFSPSAADRGKTLETHFIATDGTGTGSAIKVSIQVK